MIRLYKPTIKRKDMDAVLNCLVSEQISAGEKNRELAQQLKSRFQAAEVHLLRSYPKAVELGLRAFGVQEGGAVAVSSLSPGHMLLSVSSLGAEPLCCDVLPEVLTIDPERIPDSADAVVLHEPVGLFPEQSRYEELSIPVLEDVTQSFGSSRNESKPGEIGSILVLGLEEHHLLTAGGGAALIVKDRSFVQPLQEELDREGELSLLPDMNAALGLSQLALLDEHLSRRREFFELFYKSLLKTRHQAMIDFDEQHFSSCYTFPVLLESDCRTVMKFARKYRVEVELTFSRCILSELDLELEDYPQSVPYLLRAMNFPLYPMLSQEQTKTLIRVLAALP